VSDAAGLSASAQQQVIVRNQAPVLSNAVGDQQAIEGQPFTLDLSAVFTDTDSLLVLTLAGLPDGSGLLFDGQQLFGVPTDADAQAAPLQLDLVAMDETTPVATSFVLAVTDVNNAPSFSVVNSLTLAEDFVTPAMLTVESDPADGPSSPTFSLDQGTVDFASLAIDPQSGSVSISSLPDANGQGVFTITADDGAAVNNLFSQQVSLQVTPVNDVPVFVFDGSIAVVPGFNGSATVNVVPAAVPADEANETVLYSMNHAIPWATISIDSSNGAVTISDVANIVAAGLIAVTADDGNGGQHTEMLSLVVRESDKTLYAGELSGPLIDPISPVFPDPDEVPLSYRASGLPPSLAIDTANGAISGIPTSDDVQTGVFAASITVTGTFGTEATFPLTLNVVERDVDLDGLPDRFEPGLGIDPTQDDSDADGVVDGVEQAVGSDPLDPGAKIVKLSDDDGLQWLAAAQLGFASEQAPLFVLLAPGVYNSVLQLNPPCDYIHVVGGVDAAGETPDDSTPTLLAAGVQFEGCQASSLQHVHIFAASSAAVAVAGSDVLLTRVSLGGQDQDGLDVNASNVVISDSVIDLQGLGGLADATSSTLLFADSLLCTSGSAHFALDNSDVELVRVEAPAELLATPGVLVDTPVQRQRVQPDLGSFTVTDDAVYLDLWYHEFALTRGYDVAVHANGSPLSVFDINDGRYIVLVDDNADMQNITLRVNGHPVDYVIDTADND
ncbi:MAG: hypothetical protein HKN49_06355, partial [Gammaproteobacteria bacterium]|nr:hypothetical protein [Gammaproteobacteria bacterium]